MNNSIKKGLSFGLTSGVITTLGLIVGMFSGTHSQGIIIGSILTIAIADSLSDGLGIHLSEESQKATTSKDIWIATFSTIITKFIVAISFILPILLFSLNTAIMINLIWGFLILTLFSYLIAKSRQEKPINVIFEHITIAIIVIVATYFIGEWISKIFN